ncbi:TIGR01458 family HAD-type hydrolase [Methanocalculus taiwanensis]|uniref:Haloacid dehalogenase-like hydrolase domain-containing protein 2 n=1 Tax=Methanocalculus taiwanensis TaxID=106207 RepID=A0ABD4TL41_9EURY|nr:TIGR01458 family HAD-type hydrolase [Methanocalculus taiwanensis]MCQ1539156.1 TIGR01458 family HAD-type hydrolase [Methanocalculus taiwanensis]
MPIQALLIDIDGVLAVGGVPIPGAPGAIRWIEDQGIPHRFVSNSTQRSRRQIAERLNQAGFAISEDQITTPIVSALRLLEEKGISVCRLLMTDAARSEFSEAGITESSGGAEAIIIGDAGSGFTFSVLNEAFRQINDGALFIALERDRYWMSGDGLTLAAGPFVAALEYATGRDAVVLGKPSPDAFLSACAMMGVEPEHTAMIGDDIRTDVGGAQAAALVGVLVKTGKYSWSALKESGVKPDMILPSIASVRELFG